jgi:putative ABC transport system substrate-binding protein
LDGLKIAIFIIDYRWAGGDALRVQSYAAELVALKPDVILAYAPAVLAALRHETRTIPIVFVSVADPVGGGFVASLAAPGGNITGFTNYEFSIGGKWLATLKEIAPHVNRVMVVLNPGAGICAHDRDCGCIFRGAGDPDPGAGHQ